MYCGKKIWFFGLPIREDCYNKYLDFHLSGLGWKDKYDSPRHEWDPYLAITLFRKWQLIFIWNFIPYFHKNRYSGIISSENWECILEMACYSKNSAYLKVSFKVDDIIDINNLNLLTKYGREEYNKAAISLRGDQSAEEDI